MRSLLARLALVGLVGVALAGCGASSGTTLPAGSSANASGGGPVNTTNGIGSPPIGTISSVMIDNGNVSAAYTAVSGVGSDVTNIVQAFTDPSSAAVPSVPSSPSGPTLSQSTDTGSHAVTISGNNLTVLKMKWGGTVPNLSYPFGTAGNSTFIDYSNIIAHFALGLKANATVTVGAVTSGDTVTICVNGPTGCVGYTVQSGDTSASVAAALVRNFNNATNPNVGPTGTVAAAYAWVDVTTATIIRLAAAASGAGAASSTPPAGNTGNTMTLTTAVQSGSPAPLPGPGPNTVVTAAGTGANTCVNSLPAAGPTTTCTGVTFTGGTTTGAPGTFSAWAIELVGNGTAAGPGSPAATYDVRLTCTATAVGSNPDMSANRFVCGPLPAYGAASNLAPTSGLQGAGTYNVPVEAVFPSAAGAFTPVSPTMYVELVYTNGTNSTVNANPWIDYIYAAQ